MVLASSKRVNGNGTPILNPLRGSYKLSGSLNCVNRKNEMNRINQCNQKMLKQLQQVKPTIGSMGEWKQHEMK